MSGKGPRLQLSTKEKKEICTFSEKWPKKSQQDVTDHFSTVWKKAIKIFACIVNSLLYIHLFYIPRYNANFWLVPELAF